MLQETSEQGKEMCSTATERAIPKSRCVLVWRHCKKHAEMTSAQPPRWESLCDLVLVRMGRGEVTPWQCPTVTLEQLKRQGWLSLGGGAELREAARKLE